MGSQHEMKKKLGPAPIAHRSRIVFWIALASIFFMTIGNGSAKADMLDYLAPWSVGGEFMYSWIGGQMGFDQQKRWFWHHQPAMG